MTFPTVCFYSSINNLFMTVDLMQLLCKCNKSYIFVIMFFYEDQSCISIEVVNPFLADF